MKNSFGDGFRLDITFLSRDIDSNLIQREVDAVNYWLKTNTVFHAMRGN